MPPSIRLALLLFASVVGAVVAAPAIALESPASGDSAMVATAHPLATTAAVEVLRRGGNAVDAAVCAAFVLAVVEPYSSGLGGGGFAVLYAAGDGRAAALDFRETAPQAADRDMFLGAAGVAEPALSRDGALAVAVPAMVPGLWELHRRHGRLAWSDLLAPATRLAREGFGVSPLLRDRIAAHADRFDAAMRAVFLPDGSVPAVGDRLVQSDLARTLASLAGAGEAPITTGDVARAIATAVQAAGGRLVAADLAAYRPVWREPVRGRYRDLAVISMPPPSSGGVHLIEMLNVLAGYDLAAAGYGGAGLWHPLAEAMKFAFADRSRFLGDPDFVSVPVDRLTSRAYADSLRRRLRPDRAVPESTIVGAAQVPAESQHTTHLSVVDPGGGAVAMTLTINLSFGAGLMAPTTGVILNDEMDDFVAAPGVPNAFGLIGGDANAVAPGKRPLSSMTPTILVDDRGTVRLVTGSPGGSRIITTTLQTIVHVVDLGMDALQAVRVPRIHHQWYPPVLYHEPFGMSPDTAAELERRGHTLAERPPMGNAQLILRDTVTGRLHGASDPRGMGLAAGF